MTHIDTSNLKAIAFDFGGTIDSPFLHWMDIYLKIYVEQMRLPLTPENFREAYIYAEQMMERHHLVQPTCSLYETQHIKVQLQFRYLLQHETIDLPVDEREAIFKCAAQLVTDYASGYVAAARPVLETLHRSYTLLLVSNYYGNIAKIASDLDIASFFYFITDSTIAGVRKPDPELWRLAIEQAGFTPAEVAVVGDSYKNDIQPALTLGCQVIMGIPAHAVTRPNVCCVRRLEELPSLLCSK
ncbi:MAG: HAD family hydrolase [Prevotellaceae bacterium]|jgi:putative hydrolase of the HAD superfamily|nr:HAD family hydrolase [Prevotellaceae bacterium]